MSATIDLLVDCVHREKPIEISPGQALEILNVINDLEAVVNRHQERLNLLTQKYAELNGNFMIANEDCKKYRKALRKIIKRAKCGLWYDE